MNSVPHQTALAILYSGIGHCYVTYSEAVFSFFGATRKPLTLEKVFSHAFQILGLDWKDHGLFKPTDIMVSSADKKGKGKTWVDSNW